jgi:hypothetical protein
MRFTVGSAVGRSVARLPWSGIEAFLEDPTEAVEAALAMPDLEQGPS